MNAKIYVVGRCPVCGQGEITIAKEKTSNNLLLICDDCESQWESPEILLSDGEHLKEEKHNLDLAVKEEEIKSVGWEKYITGYLY